MQIETGIAGDWPPVILIEFFKFQVYATDLILLLSDYCYLSAACIPKPVYYIHMYAYLVPVG